MATKKKMLQAAAGNAGGAGLDVAEVFSTYLYEGNSSTQTITNGIDLDGEGGMVWLQNRTSASGGRIDDTERNLNDHLRPFSSDAPITYSVLSSLNSDGFSLVDSNMNTTNNNYVSWTFRKAPKFFDVVTYTGNGVTGREIPHSLGSDVGLLIIKCTSASNFWFTHHISRPSGALFLDSTDAETTGSTKYYMGNDVSVIQPTSTHFTVGGSTAGTMVNGSGETYVAYLFAHNDGDGGFGPDGSDIIKCGSFSVNGSYEADVDIGFEPQWVLIKPAEDSGSWLLFDTMRGAVVNGDAAWLAPNLTQQEANTANRFWPTATGFHIGNYGIPAGNDIIYIAIRRGPLAAPTAGTDVFAIDQQNSSEPYWTSNFPVDFQFVRRKDASDSWYSSSRLLQGKELVLNSTAAEGGANIYKFDYMNGWGASSYASDAFSWMWKRAPGFCDVVAYTGNQTAGHNISHNLGVAPEMMWVKKRDGAADWRVYHSGIGATKYLTLNSTAAAATHTTLWNDTAPTNSVFTLGTESSVNTSGSTYIAYLFSTLAGISKVGSYTGNGSSQTIDCGFTSGARFVLVKDTTGGNWFVYDSLRGITSGSDPALRLNLTNAEVSTTNAIAPNSSGFIVEAAVFNNSGDSYIFYAIA